MALNLKNVPYELDDSIRSRAAIGMVILATDHTMEHEFDQILNMPGLALYRNRIRNEVQVTKETLGDMENRLLEASEVILPGMTLDVLAFGCTSASMVIGPDKIEAICQKGKPGVKVTNPLNAAIAALKHLGAFKIGLVTPYREDLNEGLKMSFTAAGINIVAMASFNVEDDNIVGRISPASIEKVALDIGQQPDVDAVFISCTNLRIADRVEMIEKKLGGKPVTSSNHAMAWHALCLANVSIADLQLGHKWGSLFTK